LAITPYPNQLTETFTLKDGTKIFIRPVRAEDEPLIVALHAGHSERTLRMRFFSLVKTLSRDSLIRLCHLDYAREMALAAVENTGNGPRLLGVSRFHMDPESREAEFAVVVGDQWQGKGLGRHLMEKLITVAKTMGVKRLVGVVLRENNPMLKLMSQLGFTNRATEDDDVVEAVRDIGS
jgi:acetyltransferase